MKWAAKYVGLPFADHGRDHDGVDCWGLVRLVLLEQCSIEVPSYGETSAHDLAMVTQLVGRDAYLDPWVPVMANGILPFDVAVMFRRHDPTHVGIMVDNERILHIEEKIAAVMLPLSHPTIAFRRPRFFRHRDLLHDRAA
jgi:cell wall-associated NlpC family hydrolase